MTEALKRSFTLLTGLDLWSWSSIH